MCKPISRFICGLIAAIVIAASAGSAAPPASTRLVAVGDIHGDIDAFTGLLQSASLIDSNLRWSGGNATLVQTGDFLDRGPKTRAVMDLLMKLQQEASRRNGRVIVLLGNHEVMNMIGELRDATAGDFSAYVDRGSERKRKAAYASYAELGDPATRLPEQEWNKSHPLGFVEHRQALGPNGKYGRWLRSLPAVARVGDSLFLHGGIAPEFATWSVERLNEAISNEIKAFDGYVKVMVDEKIAMPFYTLQEIANAVGAASIENREKLSAGILNITQWMTIRPDGPLWFRGYARWSDDEGLPLVNQLTQAFGVRRFVVGHTPQPGQILSRFGGQVYLIDTGMFSAFFPKGRASALEIQDGKIREIYSK